MEIYLNYKADITTRYLLKDSIYFDTSLNNL